MAAGSASFEFKQGHSKVLDDSGVFFVRALILQYKGLPIKIVEAVDQGTEDFLKVGATMNSLIARVVFPFALHKC